MFTAQEVKCFIRESIPDESEDISEIMNLKNLDCAASFVDIYFRSQEECPFNRGNWIIDIKLNNNGIVVCIKLPKEMSKEAVYKYCEPLLKLEEKKR